MASTTRAEEKARLRRSIAQAEQALSPEARHASDQALFRQFLASPQVRAANTILLFWGMGAEPDTEQLFPPLLARGKIIGLPRCLPGSGLEFRRYLGGEHTVLHRYGMREPDLDCPALSPEQAELVLVPAVCYDETCLRLGRGGGFYDRFLARFSGHTVGLCREAFLQTSVPAEAHDCRVELVLTEHRSIGLTSL